MTDRQFEQGPIRPPSEADSLLVRVSRNCPWNRCAFCPVYKGARFSLRSADEVIADLDAMREVYGDGPRTAFLQDANPLLTPPADLVRILDAVRSRFPNIERITAYARAHTLVRRGPADLARLRAAGLDRVHIGLESGCDAVLAMIAKGSSRAEQIEGGQRARAAGFEVSEYVMPALGGQALSDRHADDTASALVEIEPHFVRLRTTAVVPGTPLAKLRSEGKFEPLGEVETVREVRRLIAGIAGLETRFASDHSLNLLMELQGTLPRDHGRLLQICDDFLAQPERTQQHFVLARRMGWVTSVRQLESPVLKSKLERMFADLEKRPVDFEQVFAELRRRTV